jgi:hypothetical protein
MHTEIHKLRRGVAISVTRDAQREVPVPIDPGASVSVKGRLEQQLAELEEWGPKLATEPIG